MEINHRVSTAIDPKRYNDIRRNAKLGKGNSVTFDNSHPFFTCFCNENTSPQKIKSILNVSMACKRSRNAIPFEIARCNTAAKKGQKKLSTVYQVYPHLIEPSNHLLGKKILKEVN